MPQITVEQNSFDISAVELGYMPMRARREVLISLAYADSFIADCEGWHNSSDGYTNRERFDMGYGVVLAITTADWAAWLETHEAIAA